MWSINGTRPTRCKGSAREPIDSSAMGASREKVAIIQKVAVHFIPQFAHRRRMDAWEDLQLQEKNFEGGMTVKCFQPKHHATGVNCARCNRFCLRVGYPDSGAEEE